MNYRHAFHAGNHADVTKHVVLLECLAHLAKKPAPFAVLDAFAGIGRYDLESDEARRSPEWQGGVARIWDWEGAPPAIEAYRQALRRNNADGALRIYPGSPVLARQALRPQDRLVLCEKHGEDAPALRALFRNDGQVQVHARDAWEALGALLPLPEKRGLILIDPAYEETQEVERAAQALQAALTRFETGIYIWWRPLKEARAVARADEDLMRATRRPALRVDLAVARQTAEGKLTASGLLIVNPPFGLEETLRAALPPLSARLAAGEGAGFDVRTL